MAQWLETNGTDKSLVAETFYPDITDTIAGCLFDIKEGIREAAAETLQLLLDCVNTGDSVNPDFLLSILSHISRRLDFTSREPVEEIRLCLLELVCAHCCVLCMVSKEGSWSSTEIAGWVATIIESGCRDVFPDAKVKAAEAIIKLIPNLKTNPELLGNLRENAKDFAFSMISNMSHSHAKVRKMMVRALSALVLGFSDQGDLCDWVEEIMPRFQNIRHDRSPGVRLIAMQEFSSWLNKMSPKSEIIRAQLLVIIIHSINDEVQEVASNATKFFEKGDIKKDLLKESLSAVAKRIIEDLGDWSANNRLYGLRTLLGLADLVDGLVSTFLEKVLPLLLKLILDDKEFSNLTRLVLRRFGCKVNPSSYLEFFWQHLGNRNIVAIEHFKSGFSALTELLAGVSRLEEMTQNAGNIALKIGDECFYHHESSEIREGVCAVVTMLLKASPRLSIEVQEVIFRIIWQLQGSEEYYGGENIGPICKAMAQCRDYFGLVHTSPLYSTYSVSMLEDISSKMERGSNHSTRLHEAYLFLVLIRELRIESSKVLPQIVHTLKVAASVDGKSDKQAHVNAVLYEAMKDLLEEVLASNVSQESLCMWNEYALPLLKEVFIPQSKWYLGRGHEAKRERSLEVVKLLLELQVISTNKLRELLPELVPILLSNFDENSKIMRLAVNSTFAMIMKALPNHTLFDDKNILEVSRALISRLDDADDEVRIAVTRTLILLIPCIHKEESRRAEEILHAGFIHLDDGNLAVREAAFKLLKAYRSTFSKEFFKEADIFKDKHTHPALVDKLINLPSEKESESLPAGNESM